MRFHAATALLLAGSVAAHASFELALVLDKTTRKVHRFDASTGIYLGSFGNFSASPTSISINQANNECAVYDGGAGAVLHFNYNTGQYLGGTTSWTGDIPKLGFNGAGTQYFAPYLSTVYRYSLQGDYIFGYASGMTGSAAGKYGIIDNNRALIADGTSRVYVTNYSTNTTGPGTLITGGVNGLASTGLFAGSRRVAAAALANGAVSLLGLDGSNNVSITNTYGGVMSSAADIHTLHNGFIAVGRNSGGSAVIQTYYLAISGSSSSLTNGISMSGGGIADPVSVAVVVAPEPASMAALALGIGVMLRRRKRTR